MQANKMNTKKPSLKNNRYLHSTHYHDQTDSQAISESQDSEYRVQQNKAKHQITGRRQTNSFERKRRAYKSNLNVVLSQYFDAKSIGEMAIYKNLFELVESWEICQFLGETRGFVEILKLQMEDRSLNLSIDTFQKNDFQQQFVFEPVPRTFICGLTRLKEVRGIQKNSTFKVSESQIKGIYIATLLLMNLGQIPKKQRIQKNNQSHQTYFHRIVTYLLDQSSFLTPKLFYYITLNWNKIIQMLINQFQTDRNHSITYKEDKKGNQNLNYQLNSLQIKETTQISLNFQTQTQQIFFNSDSQHHDLIMDEESLENSKSQFIRSRDEEFKFFTESKKREQKQRSQETSENLEAQNKKYKRPHPNMQMKKGVQIKKRIKPNELNPAVQKAQKLYNYGQCYTRDRTARKKRNVKKIKSSQINQQKRLEAIKENKMVEQKAEKKVIIGNVSEQFSCSDENFRNFFDDHNESYSYRRKDSISSIDKFFSETFGSSEDQHLKASSEEEVPQNQQEQDEWDIMMVVDEEEPAEEQKNVNRKVRHEKREIDHMIKAIIQDRFVMIQSMACQIYHSLKAMNSEIVWEERECYKQNLTRLFEEQ